MSTDKGYVRLYRDIRDHWLWAYKPFDERSAFIDLIMSANHTKNMILFDNKPMSIERGQLLTSFQILADRWGWSRGKVRRYMDLLQKEKMIDKVRHSNGTLVTIVNYGVYQDSQHTKQHTYDTPTTHPRPTAGHKQGIIEDTIEDIKKKKNDASYEAPPPDDEVGTPWSEEGWH